LLSPLETQKAAPDNGKRLGFSNTLLNFNQTLPLSQRRVKPWFFRLFSAAGNNAAFLEAKRHYTI
jgi:hypothetical protein